VTHLGHELDPSAIAVPHVAQKDIGSLPKTCRTEVIRITGTRQSEIEAVSAFSVGPGAEMSCPGRGGRPRWEPGLRQESKGDRDFLRAVIGAESYALRDSPGSHCGAGRQAQQGARYPRLS
jgi:hypothetical protein